jgi:hypothetical protein
VRFGADKTNRAGAIDLANAMDGGSGCHPTSND